MTAVVKVDSFNKNIDRIISYADKIRALKIVKLKLKENLTRNLS